MRVAYVCSDPGVPVFGCKGCSVHVQEVLRELVRRGHEVDLFAAQIGGTSPQDLSQVRVHSLELPKCDDCAARERALVTTNETIARLLATFGPYQLIYERYSLFSYAAIECARNRIIPGILEVNSPLVAEQAEYRELVDRELAEQITRRVMTMAGAVVAVSRPVADYVESQRLEPLGIHVVPNGVDVSRFRVETPIVFPRRPSEFTIGFVGTLKPWHGVSELIEAFGQVSAEEPGTSLLIVGEGPERERLEQQAARLPDAAAQRVRFTGVVPPSEVPDLLQTIDVAVAPFKPRDDFYFSPLKIFEYMAAGLPIVASDVGQIAELVDAGKTGLLVPPGKPQALAEAIVTLCRQPALCTQLGHTARAVVESRYTWEAVVSRISEITHVLRRKLSHRPKPHLVPSVSRVVNNRCH